MTNNYINTNGVTSGPPSTQPSTSDFWLNGGVLTFWNGTSNSAVDFNDGDVLDAFGVATGIDI